MTLPVPPHSSPVLLSLQQGWGGALALFDLFTYYVEEVFDRPGVAGAVLQTAS